MSNIISFLANLWSVLLFHIFTSSISSQLTLSGLTIQIFCFYSGLIYKFFFYQIIWVGWFIIHAVRFIAYFEVFLLYGCFLMYFYVFHVSMKVLPYVARCHRNLFFVIIINNGCPVWSHFRWFWKFVISSYIYVVYLLF